MTWRHMTMCHKREEHKYAYEYVFSFARRKATTLIRCCAELNFLRHSLQEASIANIVKLAEFRAVAFINILRTKKICIFITLRH